MKRKGVRVMVGLVLVCLLTGILGVYSVSASTEIGLTYRLNDWGGLKIYAPCGFGGELLVDYSHYSEDDYYARTYVDFQSSLLYRFKGSSDTSPYLGIGYSSYTNTYIYDDWGDEIWQESGFSLLAGMERSFGKNLSFDLRATVYFNTWKDTWYYSDDHGTRSGLNISAGVFFHT